MESVRDWKSINRGYRASQFEDGVIAGKICLAAYDQKIGAYGSTFFDDAVEFFSPHAADKSTMTYLIWL
jgi:hypothetical protein